MTTMTTIKTKPPTEATDHWQRAFPLSSLPVGESRAIKLDGQQVAIFHRANDVLFACDNRCPHEGYPLAKGRVLGESVLMCIWHSFTFNLNDGKCLFGDEDVRVFPVRVVDGQIEVEMTTLDPAESIPSRFESLNTALIEKRMSQAARDVVRLIQAGVSPNELVEFAALFDARHAEMGAATHALPLAADTLRLLPRFPGVEAVRPLMQLFDMASEPTLSPSPRQQAPSIDPGDDPVAAGKRLREAAEAMRIGEPEGLLRGALAKGWGREEIEPWFFRLCTDHFIAFGHGLIYQLKVFDMLDQIGWQHADEILAGHLQVVAFGPREERIPNHAALLRALERVDPKLDAWYAKRALRELGPADQAVLCDAVLDGTVDEAIDAVAGYLDSGVMPASLVRTLSLAASERLLRFDPDIDADASLQENWLDVTHTLTTAHATRQALERFDHPTVLRTLFHLAYFIQRTGPLDAEESLAIEPAQGATLESVTDAVRGLRADEAVANVGGYLAAGGDAEALRYALEDVILGDHGVRPIFVTHMIKTLLAAHDESRALAGDPQHDRPLIACTRYLASRVREHELGGVIEDALRFLVDAKTPRRLSP
jgi:nitrite reductase/ring-hydroxylating ferredoxin subunit